MACTESDAVANAFAGTDRIYMRRRTLVPLLTAPSITSDSIIKQCQMRLPDRYI